MKVSSLIVQMESITKGVYTTHAKSKSIIAKRPCGFVTEFTSDKGNVYRRMFIEHDGAYYSGLMMPWDSLEDFNTMQFDDVQTITRAVFKRMPEAA